MVLLVIINVTKFRKITHKGMHDIIRISGFYLEQKTIFVIYFKNFKALRMN